MTPMRMTKTQVYFPDEELKQLHLMAQRAGRPVAELIREAVRASYLRPVAQGPVALWNAPFHGSSSDHDAAFDEI